MRHGLGEDRLHRATIAARAGLCSPQMARAARSKHRKPAATPPPSSPSRGDSGTRRTRVETRSDLRRWIYAGLDLAFATLYIIAITKVIPNRLPSGILHLWTFPVASLAMAVGMVLGNRDGW